VLVWSSVILSDILDHGQFCHSACHRRRLTIPMEVGGACHRETTVKNATRTSSKAIVGSIGLIRCQLSLRNCGCLWWRCVSTDVNQFRDLAITNNDFLYVAAMNNEGYMLILISEAPSKIQASFKFSLFLLFVCEPKCSFAHPSEHVETEFLSIIFKKKK
jgi:hypothetical protein